MTDTPGNLGGGDIVLGATILPIYVGAVTAEGKEPMTDSAYRRGTIQWDVMPEDEVIGKATILVPAGTWRWLIYTYHPTADSFIFAEKLLGDFVFQGPSQIKLDCVNSKGILHRPNVLPD